VLGSAAFGSAAMLRDPPAGYLPSGYIPSASKDARARGPYAKAEEESDLTRNQCEETSRGGGWAGAAGDGPILLLAKVFSNKRSHSATARARRITRPYFCG